VVSIEASYLRDDFNLFGLSSLIENYTDAMRIILGRRSLTKQISDLYTMTHARYLLTIVGAQKMKDKFEKWKFGFCLRTFCRSQALLPIGLDPAPGKGRVMTYCPCCRNLCDPGVEPDGAFFGPSFPHFFVQAVDLRVPPSRPECRHRSQCLVSLSPRRPDAFTRSLMNDPEKLSMFEFRAVKSFLSKVRIARSGVNGDQPEFE
jgi:hypothetical protein